MKVKKTPVPGGELEYAVLSALWDLGSASAPEIYERVGAPSGLVYTTVAKVLDRLHDKGLVARVRWGKSFRYTARIERGAVERARAREGVARLLGAEPASSIAYLVQAVESLDPKLLDDLARAVEKRRRSRRGS